MPSEVAIIAISELEKMPTGSLLTRLKNLQVCEESAKCSDLESAIIESGFIHFKDEPEWSQAHRDLKEVLSHREHLPTAAERQQRRVSRALTNKTKETKR